jgi:hypothetical protein
LFDLAFKARLPIIGVQTDDTANFDKVLAFYAAPKKVASLAEKHKTLGPYLYWTDDEDLVTTDTYEEFRAAGLSLIVLNFDTSRKNPLIFDGGILPTPDPLVRYLLSDMLGEEWVEPIIPGLRGLSLKSIREVLLLTQARVNGITLAEIRRTRSSLVGGATGLYLEDSSYDFYQWPEHLRAWLELNKSYFHKETHHKLVPRGLMFNGPPGVGKSMAAKAIANTFGVPLYRFDISSTLDKYIGVSEGRVQNVLDLVNREAPCVLLLDEVEKIFQGKEDSGVINRLLSKLLWWLAEHQSRVFTVMTTNDKSSIPPELYRTGRIDKVMPISKLTFNESRKFAAQVFESILEMKPALGQVPTITKALQSIAPADYHPDFPLLAHADVTEVVVNEIKKHGWDVPKK